MMPAMPIPQAEFAPYLLQQAGLRASLLQLSFGFAADDWDDMRQDMALDCIGRLPRFDASRGDWRKFVRGVVRNEACALDSRQARRPAFRPLEMEAASERSECCPPRALTPLTEDLRGALDLKLDTQRVLNRLPEELRLIAGYLTEMSFLAVSRKMGLTHTGLARKVERIRGAFLAAGLTPGAVLINRGGQ
jgi:hypothetical protein